VDIWWWCTKTASLRKQTLVSFVAEQLRVCMRNQWPPWLHPVNTAVCTYCNIYANYCISQTHNHQIVATN